MRHKRKSVSGFTLIELMIVIAIIAILAAILIPNFVRARAMGQLTACKSNLRTIATSLEMYSVDHDGHYASSLAVMTPNYMKTIPLCPAAGSDTYSAVFNSTLNPDAFSFYCDGSFHAMILPANYPQWDGTVGLIER